MQVTPIKMAKYFTQGRYTLCPVVNQVKQVKRVNQVGKCHGKVVAKNAYVLIEDRCDLKTCGYCWLGQ